MDQHVAGAVAAASLVAGVTGSVLLGAGAGAVVALLVSSEPLRVRGATALAGFVLAVAGSQPLGTWLELNESLVGGLALLLSIFGIPLVLEGRALFSDGTIRQFVKGLFNRKGGTP